MYVCAIQIEPTRSLGCFSELIWYYSGSLPQSDNMVCPVYCQDVGTQRIFHIPPFSVKTPI